MLTCQNGLLRIHLLSEQPDAVTSREMVYELATIGGTASATMANVQSRAVRVSRHGPSAVAMRRINGGFAGVCSTTAT